MLTKQTVVDRVEVTENGTIQVRTATRILDDGIQISQTYHRHCLSPGDDLTGQDKKVAAIAKTAWTKEVREKFKNDQEFKNDQK